VEYCQADCPSLSTPALASEASPLQYQPPPENAALSAEALSAVLSTSEWRQHSLTTLLPLTPAVDLSTVWG